jgi:hypothetical protein
MGVEQTLDALFMSKIPHRMDNVPQRTGIMNKKLSLTMREP